MCAFPSRHSRAGPQIVASLRDSPLGWFSTVPFQLLCSAKAFQRQWPAIAGLKKILLVLLYRVQGNGRPRRERSVMIGSQWVAGRLGLRGLTLAMNYTTQADGLSGPAPESRIMRHYAFRLTSGTIRVTLVPSAGYECALHSLRLRLTSVARKHSRSPP